MSRLQEVPRLFEENLEFAGTGGVSECNSKAHFIPAFQNSDDGEVKISCFKNGCQATFHLLDGLPDEWIEQRDHNGRVVKIKSTIVSGFVRLNRFFTRGEAAYFIEELSADLV